MTFKTFFLGCKVNSYECSAISQSLLKAGYLEDINNPDIVIINTCSVTATADQKSRQHIRKLKKAYPEAVLVVMGCYAQGNVEYISKNLDVDILLGTTKRNKIIEYVNKYLETKEKIIDVDTDFRNFKYEELGITSCSENTRAYLKIQDGCNNFCTYCIVPFRRGRMRSRAKEDILKEAKEIVNKGYQEIVLTGIHVGGYGQDLNDISFSSLVEFLSDIKGLNSLRISSIEASEIDDKLIDLISKKDNIAKHLHIPLQSGSDNILKAMNRKYSKNEFISKISLIKERVPNIAITSDVIVGFPNESESDFESTYEVIKECFNMVHVFPYSPREGTVASKMKNQISPLIKTTRCKKILELSKELWEEYISRFINQEVSLIVERFDEKNNLNYGHTSNYLEVKIHDKNNLVGQKINILLQKDMIISK